MRILVTGATGLIGTHVLSVLPPEAEVVAPTVTASLRPAATGVAEHQHDDVSTWRRARAPTTSSPSHHACCDRCNWIRIANFLR
jgi:nucleoside-diphosphate-sugar epimerase